MLRRQKNNFKGYKELPAKIIRKQSLFMMKLELHQINLLIFS